MKLDATARTEGGTTFSAYADCTYRSSAQIWSFKVTNEGQTQRRIIDGEESDKCLTVHHQLAKKSCAYWTFDVTVKNAGNEINAGNTLLMYAVMQDGRTVAIPLTKKSSDGEYTRFVGEYVDEAYLQLLAAHPDTTFGISELDGQDLFIPQTYAFNSFALAYASNLDDEDFKKRIKERAEQEAKDRYAFLETLFENVSLDDAELSETMSGVDESLQLFKEEIEQRVQEGDLTEEEAQASLAEIEALLPDFQYPTALLAPTDDTWTATIDVPYFTGEDPDIGEYSIPTDAQIEQWYAGEDEATIQEVKAFFRTMKDSIDTNYASAKLTNRAIRNNLDAMGEGTGVGKVSTSGSAQALADRCLEGKVGDILKITDGDSTKGDLVQTMQDGRFEASLFVTDSQKNGADGKVEGIYSGYSCVVTESAPAGAADPQAKKQSTYKVDFSKHKETDDHMRSAKVDALKTVGLTIPGVGMDMASGYLEKGSKEVLDNVLQRRILKNVPPDQITPLMKAWAKTQMWAQESDEVARTISKCEEACSAMGGLGVILNGVGEKFAMDSWLDTMDAIGVLEADIESINQWILYYKKRNPCDGDCQNCLKALYAERDAAEEYLELMHAEDDHNYSDVLTSHWNTAISLMTFVASRGSGSVANAAGTFGNVTGKASLATDGLSTSIHLMRAQYLDKARYAYDMAAAYRQTVCKEVPKKGGSGSAETNGGGGTEDYRSTIDWNKFYGLGSKVILDPSGIVYEALDSNPVEGAKATIYVADDANGRNARKWNAEDYEQEGTLTTGADGAFQWDTPTGFYQVRVAKEGYDVARTDWLSVLPIRTGLKVGLKSTQAPSVVAANACPEYIELEFSQYMKADEGAGTSALVGGEDARLEWVDSTDASDADGGGALSKVLRIYPQEDLAEGSNILLELNGAKSYTGRALGDLFGTWSQTLAVEKRPAQLVANYENAIVLQSDAAEPVQVVAYVRYADGTPVANQPVTARVNAPSIAAIDGVSVADASDASSSSAAEGITDSQGKASFALKGDLPGMTTLTLAASGTSLTKELAVRTTSDAAQPTRPTASIGTATFGALAPKDNSVTVPKGSKLTLTTTTEGATIYYTTDDTCPCDANGTRHVYTGPISVMGETKYRIAAYKEGMPFDEYSERLNLAVQVSDEGGDPSGGGEQGGSENGGSDSGNSGSTDGNQGTGDGSNAGEGDQQAGADRTANASVSTDTDKLAQSLGYLAATNDGLNVPAYTMLILLCVSALALASLFIHARRKTPKHRR